MDQIKVDFTKKGRKGAKEIFIPPEKAGVKIVINIIVMVLTAAIGFYFMLPAINLRSTQFYMYIAMVLGSYAASAFITSKAFAKPEYMPYVRRQATVPVIILLAFLLILGCGYVSSATIFRAKAYSRILDINEAPFAESKCKVETLEDFNKIPLIDADSAKALANKTVGDLGTEWASQYLLEDTYTVSINYKEQPTRAYPLKYGDVFKWLKNRSEGQPGYIIINMNTQKSEFVKLQDIGLDNIKYTMTEHFGRYFMRMVRFEHPTFLLANPCFEIDDEGTPFWTVEHITKRVGLLGGDDVIGLVMVNACTGDMFYYTIDEIRTGTADSGVDLMWLDRVFASSILIDQYNYFGKYSNGFINFYIGQTGVKVTTQGLNYLAIDDDIYIYSGVKSIIQDDSIIGFILINQRTKEASFYFASGTTEAGAQSAAKGIVQDKGWDATFPILINVDSQATYLMALKDKGNIVKSFAMVNVDQVNDAVRSPSDDNPNIRECMEAYISKLAQRNLFVNVDMGGGNLPGTADEEETAEGTIVSIRETVIGGYSVYYIKLADDSGWYTLSISTAPEAAICEVGDKVKIYYKPVEDGINIISAFKIELQ
ncbi:MAG: hypothetical protein FWF08_06420 [Oscillospiraceae bacterium]|nr:hypothetical protein [Oscillospiraceae bacterium]